MGLYEKRKQTRKPRTQHGSALQTLVWEPVGIKSNNIKNKKILKLTPVSEHRHQFGKK